MLVPPRDPVAIQRAVQTLMADPGLCQRLGKAAQDRIRRAHLPCHYAVAVSRLLQQTGDRR